jgi:hypothetical protein
MNTSLRVSAPLVALLGLALAPAVASAQEWKDFSSAECRCSAQFPGMPQQRTQPLQSKHGSVESKMIILDVPGTAFFALSYIDYSKEAAAKARPDENLDDARDAALGYVKGKLRDETKITMNGYPGRELKIDAPGNMVVNARMYLVKERLYQAIVVLPKSREASGDAKKFLESFKFQKP